MTDEVDRSGCNPECNPDAPCPHHECLCCNGTPADWCSCHVFPGATYEFVALTSTGPSSVPEMFFTEIMRLRSALRDARHALTTLDGLWVHDGRPVGNPEPWRIDEAVAIARIDAALGDSEE